MPHSLSTLPTWILSSAATRSHQILHHELAEAGADGYSYRCLAALADQGRMSQATLGKAAALDARDVTHTVRALEDSGLVLREKDPDHGRRILVSLTDEGEGTAKRLSAVMDRIQDKVFGGLDPAERATLLDLLGRVAT